MKTMEKRPTAKPLTSAIRNLAASILPIEAGAAADEMNIGSISSDVLRKTEMSVPAVMTPPEYRLAAPAEKPHCGTSPSPAPSRCPYLLTPESSLTD